MAIATVLLFGLAAQALAVDTSARSAAEIHARWLQLQPAHTGSPYVIAPALSAPFATGTLANGFLQDGLNSVNYARYLAGLPDDVVLDPTYTDRAQHGAVLLAVGLFAHSQTQPATMDSAFFSIANTATSSSNIGWGYSSLWDFNVSCLGDDDPGNIDRVGHRRWILHPALLKTGMGMAGNKTDMWVFDSSRAATVPYDSVKWPCAGLFPVEMFGADVPWSVTLNPALYSWTAGTAGHTVTLLRERDGKSWTFTSADADKGGEYLNFETSGFGVANCFIFRPDPSSVGGYQKGDIYDVTLSGGITNKADGSPATVSYRTQFISQADSTGLPLPPAPVVVPTATRLGGPSSIKFKRTLKLSGTRTPASAPGRVSISVTRLVHGKWKNYGRANVSVARGSFGYSYKPKYKGKWRFVAVYSGSARGTATYRASKSSVKTVLVK